MVLPTLLARPVWVATLLLWGMFALALTSMAGEGPTFDEQGFLVRGLAYLRGPESGGSRSIRVGHPLGLNALNAALLAHDPGVRLPVDDPSLTGTDFHRPAELFLWQSGNDVARTMFLARVPTVWLGLLLASVAGRWAGQMVAGWGVGRAAAGAAGLVALGLAALDPNILAHTRLVTTDLGLAAGATLAGYTLWRFLSRPSWRTAAAAGVSMGLLQNTKFTALLFIPLFAVVIALVLWVYRRELQGRLWLLLFVVYPATAVLALWATNGFQVGALQSPLPLAGTLGGTKVPLSEHLDQLIEIGGRLQVATPAFLLGQYSDSGWWYYFPVAFALKTPLPTLLLLGLALVRVVKGAINRRWTGSGKHLVLDVAALLVPAVGYFAMALTTDINLGYRHLLPVLPFTYVLIGVMVGQAVGDTRMEAQLRCRLSLVVGGLLLWLALATVWIYPHFLAFFNVIAGGPDNGWRALVDSNLDWGQDLGRLGLWLDDHGVERVWLSYFGEGRPEYYGIPYEGLDSFPPRLMNPTARPFFPHDPAPGWYAISATTLQGVHFDNHHQFDYFRERAAAGKVGYSIFLYQVLPRGRPADLLLANTQVDELSTADFDRLGTNEVTLRWFDGAQAVILPAAGAPLWLALPGEGDLHPALAPYLSHGLPEAVGEGYRLSRATGQPPMASRLLSLDGHEVNYSEDSWARLEGRTVQTMTAWRQGSAPRPIQIFVHVLDAGGRVVAQWDGLGGAWEGWRVGDTLVQMSAIELPETLPPGDYSIRTGLYDPVTSQRWRFADGQDGVELARFAIP